MSLAFHTVFPVIGMLRSLLMQYPKVATCGQKTPFILNGVSDGRRGRQSYSLSELCPVRSFPSNWDCFWPRFMQYAGAIIGMPFSLEGFAFFTEAIFLGIYLYGWNRVSPVLHWLAGIVVAVSGVLSAVFVVLANSWMNAPAGWLSAQVRSSCCPH